jgi:hypothetical protein
MILVEDDEAIAGRVVFPKEHVSVAAVEKMKSHFILLLETMLARPASRVRDVSLP